MEIKSVLLVGNFTKGSLELSYYNAFNEKGYNVECFNIIEAENKYTRFKPFGSVINKFIPIDAWLKKANRDLILTASKSKPELIIYFGQNRFLANAIAQIKTMITAKHVLVWPDTLLNFGYMHIVSLPLYDCVASYSKSAVKSFVELGGKNVIWLPLAGDPILHKRYEIHSPLLYDISFIGQWRPEREEAISYILNNTNGINVNIWGPDWKRRSKNKKILNSVRGRGLYGDDFSKVVQSSRINLNIIDDTNFPAANMRFFEILVLGGIEVSSMCPEFEHDIKNREHIFYYKNLNELVEIINSILNKNELEIIQDNAYKHVIHNHTYFSRIEQLIEYLNKS